MCYCCCCCRRPPSQDYHSLNGALLSANSVLKRYRYTFKSDALFNELKHIVLPHMAVSVSKSRHQLTHPPALDFGLAYCC